MQCLLVRESNPWCPLFHLHNPQILTSKLRSNWHLTLTVRCHSPSKCFHYFSRFSFNVLQSLIKCLEGFGLCGLLFLKECRKIVNPVNKWGTKPELVNQDPAHPHLNSLKLQNQVRPHLPTFPLHGPQDWILSLYVRMSYTLNYTHLYSHNASHPHRHTSNCKELVKLPHSSHRSTP